MINKPLAIDLFAGGGALSEGLRQCGFEILAAVENNYEAAETFKANHPSAKVFSHDIRLLPSKNLKSLLGNKQLDLLAGCPPCQGFSSLTNKYKNEDRRNSLVREMGRLVIDLKPKAVMMENVPGLAKKGNQYFDEFLALLVSQGYIVNWKVLQVADYGVPQSRKRLVLLAGKGTEILIPEPTHTNRNQVGKLDWVTVRDAINGMPEPFSFKDAKSTGNLKSFNWNINRDLNEINLLRLKHIPPGGNRFFIPNELRPPCHQGEGKGFPNVYGRISWDKPSPTITGGCTTMSKGRFGHPEKMRTLSVREAATLQTFPPDYEFATDKIDEACKIIGNALPVVFAKAMGLACVNSLNTMI